MEELTLRLKRHPTSRQRKMAVDVLAAIGMPAEILEYEQVWKPSEEEIIRIDRAKQSAKNGETFILPKNQQREFLGL